MRQKKELGIVAIFVALFIGYSILEAFQRGFDVAWSNPQFLGLPNLLNLTRNIGLYGTFSVAMGVVIITGGIDLSIGSLFALLGVILAMMLESGFPWPIAVALVILLSMFFGASNGFLISKVRLQPFVVTLCGLLTFRGLARFISNDETKGFSDMSNYQILNNLATGVIFNVPAPFIIFVIVCIIMAFVLHVSVYGRYLFAIGRNEDAALYSGINTKLVITSAYILCGFLTGVSAVLIGFYTVSISPSSHGNFFELYAVAACVIGGCSLRGGEGSVLGIFIGTAMIQLIRNIVNLQGIQSSLEFVVMGCVILLAVLIDQALANRQRIRDSKIVEAKQPEPAKSPAT
jgi:ribose transport system permease protein